MACLRCSPPKLMKRIEASVSKETYEQVIKLIRENPKSTLFGVDKDNKIFIKDFENGTDNPIKIKKRKSYCKKMTYG